MMEQGQKKAVEEPVLSDTEDEVEQLHEQDLVSCTASDLGLQEEEQDITDQEAKNKAAAKKEKKRQDFWQRKRAQMKYAPSPPCRACNTR